MDQLSPPSAPLLALIARLYHEHNQIVLEEGCVSEEELEDSRQARLTALAGLPSYFVSARLLVDLPATAFGNA
jgi:hypothetical protein